MKITKIEKLGFVCQICVGTARWKLEKTEKQKFSYLCDKCLVKTFPKEAKRIFEKNI